MNTIALTVLDQAKILYLLIERELKSRYSHSPIGILSAVAEPLAVIGILTLIFSSIRSRNIWLGEYLMIFFATGYIPVHCFKSAANSAKNSFLRNGKMLYSSKIKPMSLLISGGIVMIFVMIVLMTIIVSYFILFHEIDLPKNIAMLLVVFAMNGAMGISVGSINVFICAFFPYWQTIFQIVTGPIALLSGIFYTAASIHQSALRYLQWNPFFHSTELFRENFFDNYTSPMFSWTYYGGWVLTLVFLGLLAERFGRRAFMRQAMYRGTDPRGR